MSSAPAITRRRAWLVLAGSIVATAAVLSSPAPEQRLPESSTGLSADYESVQAERLAADLPSAQEEPAVLVYSRVDGASLRPQDLEAVSSSLASLRGLADTTEPPTAEPAASGSAAVAVLPLPADLSDEQVGETVADLRERVRAPLPPELQVQVTGPPAFTADLLEVFEGADVSLLIVTLAVVALLLLLTYRSPFLWVVPLVVVAGAEQATLALVEQVLPRLGLATNGATTGITSVLVFGAATDYALLLIARYREELRTTADRFTAMGVALARTRTAILASGGTVVLAVLTLTLSAQESLRALGVAAALGIAIAVLSALIVLPAALVLFGRGLFWPLIPRLGTVGREGRGWDVLGRRVAARPRAVALAGVGVLVVMAFGGLGLQSGLAQSEQFRGEPESVLGAATLAKALPAGATQPLVVLTGPDAAGATAEASQAVPGVVSAKVVERTDRVARVDVVIDAEPGSEASAQAITALRQALDRVPEADAIVGGQAASAADLADAEERDRTLVIPLVLVLVGAVLVVLLRSVLAPVVLVLTVVASYAASLGASWLIFDRVLGFPALEGGVLLLSFLFLVALGVDYNIFLVSRAREEAAVSGTREGMLTALRVTGGVITSAGILLAAVFAVLGVLPLIALGQLGVIVGIGVLLDSLLVRTIVVPALALMLGERFWWPATVHEPRIAVPGQQRSHPDHEITTHAGTH
jgi:RND superfamily putative drug exporter